jgi:hypothetical protein
MPRRNQPSRRAGRPAAAPAVAQGSTERGEVWRGREFRVRSISGAGGTGSYRCPGCDQLLAASTAHVVAWSAEDPEAADRRHWHTGCWAARDRRRPVVERSRNAPRYG